MTYYHTYRYCCYNSHIHTIPRGRPDYTNSVPDTVLWQCVHLSLPPQYCSTRGYNNLQGTSYVFSYSDPDNCTVYRPYSMSHQRTAIGPYNCYYCCCNLWCNIHWIPRCMNSPPRHCTSYVPYMHRNCMLCHNIRYVRPCMYRQNTWTMLYRMIHCEPCHQPQAKSILYLPYHPFHPQMYNPSPGQNITCARFHLTVRMLRLCPGNIHPPRTRLRPFR